VKAVIDTNVVVSGVLKTRGSEAAVLNLVCDGKLIWCVSEPILSEYRRVLLNKLRFEPTYVQWLLDLAVSSRSFKPVATLKVSPDADDNRFIECAEAAAADYLVTGNRRHFPKVWKSTRVVSASELLRVLAP
jgi:putative PIN family toxin of toxin-antitoxin system